jgi:hypothetical protein
MKFRQINPLFPGARLEGESIPKTERTQNIIHDTLELAGQRDLETSQALLAERLASIRRKKHDGERRLSRAETISDIKRGQEKKISEGALTYVQLEDDAVIINVSDAHGSFNDLSKAIAEFIKRRETGENIYFNFSGDVSSGDIDEVVPCMEALASLQIKYPNEVTVELGNGDRRGTSLLMGLSREAVKRFAPALHDELEKTAADQVKTYANETGLEPEKAKAMHKFFYGAELLRLARLGGTQPRDPHEFNANFLKRLTAGMIGEKNINAPSISKMIGTLKTASEPLRPWDEEKAEKIDPSLLEEARQVFKYWEQSDRVLNEQPALAIYESPRAIVLASHTGYTGQGQTLGDLAYDPTKIDEAAWNKFFNPEKGEKAGSVEKYGPFASFPPKLQGQLLEKILPAEKPAVLITGHNHGNSTERISTGDKTILRVENCISSQPKRAGDKAAFVEIKLKELAENPTEPEKAITFNKI